LIRVPSEPGRLYCTGELPSRYDVIGAKWIGKSFIRKFGCLTQHLELNVECSNFLSRENIHFENVYSKREYMRVSALEACAVEARL
jgi:hypothetical protein